MVCCPVKMGGRLFANVESGDSWLRRAAASAASSASSSSESRIASSSGELGRLGVTLALPGAERIGGGGMDEVEDAVEAALGLAGIAGGPSWGARVVGRSLGDWLGECSGESDKGPSDIVS